MSLPNLSSAWLRRGSRDVEPVIVKAQFAVGAENLVDCEMPTLRERLASVSAKEGAKSFHKTFWLLIYHDHYYRYYYFYNLYYLSA